MSPLHSTPLSRSNAKPARGTADKMRRARKRLSDTRERAAKDGARIRDGFHCQYPGCTEQGRHVQAMHCDDKQMGGDHGLRSSLPSDYVLGCPGHHVGVRSVHTTHVRFDVGDDGGNGLVVWWRRERVPGEWVYVGTSGMSDPIEVYA